MLTYLKTIDNGGRKMSLNSRENGEYFSIMDWFENKNTESENGVREIKHEEYRSPSPKTRRIFATFTINEEEAGGLTCVEIPDDLWKEWEEKINNSSPTIDELPEFRLYMKKGNVVNVEVNKIDCNIDFFFDFDTEDNDYRKTNTFSIPLNKYGHFNYLIEEKWNSGYLIRLDIFDDIGTLVFQQEIYMDIDCPSGRNVITNYLKYLSLFLTSKKGGLKNENRQMYFI